MGGFRAEPIPGSPLLIGEVPTRRPRPDEIVMHPFPFDYPSSLGAASFQNSWTNYNAAGVGSFVHAGFYKDVIDRVSIIGLIAGGVLNTNAWDMPENFSPNGHLMLPAYTSGGAGRLYIIYSAASGTFMGVRPNAGSTTWFSTHANWVVRSAADWHGVGGGGEPAFENSWVNYGSGFVPAGFIADELHIVWLQGVVKDGTIGQNIFTLPDYYEPDQSLMLPTSGVTPASTVNVFANSIRGVNAQSGTNPHFSINCCIVPAGLGDWQVVGLALPFENSWANYAGGGDYGDTRFWKDPLGMVHIQGLMTTGTIGQTAFTLPPGYRPRRLLVTPAATWNKTIGRLNISRTGDVVPHTGSNSYFSACVSFLAEQ